MFFGVGAFLSQILESSCISAQKRGRTPSIPPGAANLRVGYLHAPGKKGASRSWLGLSGHF